MSALHAVSLSDAPSPAYPEIEPLFSMEVACELIPFPSMSAMYGWLNRHREEFPARYQKTRPGGGKRLQKHMRMISHSEILRIRDIRLIEGRRNSQYARAGRPLGSVSRKRGPISSIIARAMRG